MLPPDRTAALVLGGAGRQCVHAAVVVASTLARRTADPGFDELADWWDRYLAYRSAQEWFTSKMGQMLVETRARTSSPHTVVQADAARSKLRHQLERRRATTGDAKR